MTTFDEIKAIIIDTCFQEKTPPKITMDTYIKDIGLDSLDQLEVFLQIEQRFDVYFNNKEPTLIRDVVNTTDILIKESEEQDEGYKC